MVSRHRRTFIIIGGVLALISIVLGAILIAQPWMGCNYAQPLTCAMPPRNAGVLAVAVVAAVAGIALAAVGALARAVAVDRN